MWTMVANLLGTVTSGAAGAGAKFWAIVILVVTLTGSLGYLYWKHTNLIETVGEQKAEIAELNLAVLEEKEKLVQKEKELADTVEKYEEIRKINVVLKDREVVYNKAISELEGKLDKAGRDIGFIANMKPELMEKVINKAAKSRNRCFEVISGKPKLEGEKNEVCPHLFVK